MTKTVYFEDLEVGVSWETSGRTITETDLVVHAGHTGDFFPHHMDKEFARTTQFGERIAHGTMIFAIAIGLKAQRPNAVAFTYGFDRIRFPKPVVIGDTIRAKVVLAEKSDDPKRPAFGRYVERVEVYNQHDQVVMVCDHVALIQKRDSSFARQGHMDGVDEKQQHLKEIQNNVASS